MDTFFSFVESIGHNTKHKQIMYLDVFVDSNDEQLKQMYVEHANKHNSKITEDPHFYDAGFDIFLPLDNYFDPNNVNKIDFQVKCCAKIYDNICDVKQFNNMEQTLKYLNVYTHYTPFYTYARSSISKTQLRLANNQGIIDAGYRGSLIGMFDSLSNEEYYVSKHSRLLQICAPNLIPIYVNIVDTFEELGPATSRGDGGFGSTGI